MMNLTSWYIDLNTWNNSNGTDLAFFNTETGKKSEQELKYDLDKIKNIDSNENTHALVDILLMIRETPRPNMAIYELHHN